MYNPYLKDIPFVDTYEKSRYEIGFDRHRRNALLTMNRLKTMNKDKQFLLNNYDKLLGRNIQEAMDSSKMKYNIESMLRTTKTPPREDEILPMHYTNFIDYNRFNLQLKPDYTDIGIMRLMRGFGKKRPYR